MWIIHTSLLLLLLQFLAHLRLLNGLLPVISVFWPLFLVFNIASITVTLNTAISFTAPALYNVLTFQFTILISLILFSWLIPLPSSCLFRAHDLGFPVLSFLRWQAVGLSHRPQPEVPVYRIYNQWGRVAHRVPILVAFYDTHGLQRDG